MELMQNMDVIYREWKMEILQEFYSTLSFTFAGGALKCLDLRGVPVGETGRAADQAGHLLDCGHHHAPRLLTRDSGHAPRLLLLLQLLRVVITVLLKRRNKIENLGPFLLNLDKSY